MGEQLDHLKEAFVSALGLEPGINFDAVAYGQTDGWDSVAHMRLIADIEGTFDIMLSSEDVIDMSSFVKAREIVAKYGVAAV